MTQTLPRAALLAMLLASGLLPVIVAADTISNSPPLPVQAPATTSDVATSQPQPLAGASASTTPPQSQSSPAQAPAPDGDAAGNSAIVLDNGSAAPDSAKVQYFPGTNMFVNPRPKTSAPGSVQGDISLDFAAADVRDVIRSVLGEILHVPYTIDPQVNGQITLNTATLIRKEDVLPALETALKMSGIAITESDGVYNIVPITGVRQQNPRLIVGADRVAGYGIEILPLKYVAVDEMQKILEPLVPSGGVVRVDRQRNLMFLAGTEAERETMRQTIALFDVDYLRSMSFALIQPAHVEADVLATELDKVFEGTGVPMSGLVRLIPIARINSLLVVTSRPAFLQEVSRWVNRLDVTPVTPGRKLYYYKLQNLRAQDVVKTLDQLFGGGGSQQQATPPANSDQPSDASLPSSPIANTPVSDDGARQPHRASRLGGDGPQIVLDDANNALLIRADAGDYAAILKVLQQMDVAPSQVLIEATIAEVTLNDDLRFGVEWFFQNGPTKGTLSSNGVVKSKFPGLSVFYSVPNVQAAISTLGSLTHVAVISSPKLLTLDNQTANLEVGDQVPIVKQTSVSVSTPGAPLVSTVEMHDTGVILSVTPRIAKSGIVFLDIAQEVSDVVPTTTSGIDSPTIQQRKLQSRVAVQDGQTVALGGLIRNSVTSGNSGIPFLKDIPILGLLAGTANSTNDKTELLIFLTPHIIADPGAAVSVTRDLEKGLDDIRQLMEENQPPLPKRRHP